MQREMAKNGTIFVILVSEHKHEFSFFFLLETLRSLSGACSFRITLFFNGQSSVITIMPLLGLLTGLVYL